MLTSEITAVIEDSVADRRLLEHPFYRRWEAGELDAAELAAYADQYRHFERALPTVLEQVARSIADSTARAQVEANLADELGVPAPHVELFDIFVDAVGGQRDAEPSPAMAALVELYLELAESNPIGALSAVGAYEVQAPAIAISKAQGLRERYALTEDDTVFWDVHGQMDEDHARWTAEALASLGATESAVRCASRSAAEAWWAFLDEREEAAAQLAAC